MNYQKMRIDFMQKRKTTAPFVYKTGEVDVDGIEAELVNIDVEGSPIGFIKVVSPNGAERESALRIENGFAYFDIPKNEEGLYTVELTILNKKNKTRSGNIAIEVINSLSYDSEAYETLLDTITKKDAEYTSNENIRIENENTRIEMFDEIKTDFENLTAGKQLDSEVIIARSGKASLKDNIESKRDKSVLLTQTDLSTSSEAHKLTMNHLSQEVKNAMSGTAPVSPNLQDGQVTTEKIADGAITNEKVTGLDFKGARIVATELISDSVTIFKNWNVNTCGFENGNVYYTGSISTPDKAPFIYSKSPSALSVKSEGCYQIILSYDDTGYVTWNPKSGVVRKRSMVDNSLEVLPDFKIVTGVIQIEITTNEELYINGVRESISIGNNSLNAVGLMLHSTNSPYLAYSNVSFKGIDFAKLANNIANVNVESLNNSLSRAIIENNYKLSLLGSITRYSAEEVADKNVILTVNANATFEHATQSFKVVKTNNEVSFFCYYIPNATKLIASCTGTNIVVAVKEDLSDCIVYRSGLGDIVKVYLNVLDPNGYKVLEKIESIPATSNTKYVFSKKQGFLEITEPTSGLVIANFDFKKHLNSDYVECFGIQSVNSSSLAIEVVETGSTLTFEDFLTLKSKSEDIESRVTLLESIGGGEVVVASSRWRNKKWAVLGDSLTADHSNNPTASSQIKYHDLIKSRIGISTVYNHGIGGTCLAVGNQSNAFISRYKSIPTDASLITVWGGINDFWHSQSELGSIDSTENTTLYGALKNLCEGLLTDYPSATIAFFTPLKKNNGLTPNAKGVTLPQIRKAIIDVCELYSLQVLDLYNVSGCTPTVVANLNTYWNASDGVHLNNLGQEKISFIIQKFIEGL